MANLEIVGKNPQCYLYIYINDNVYCIDKDNCVLNLEIPQGKCPITIIGTKTKKYNSDESLKSMSFKIKPALIQGYKDKKFLNRILGWNNSTYFFIKKINVDVRSKARLNLAVKYYFIFNYLDVKENIKDVEITTNSHIKTISTESFNFISKNQKIRYYTIQFLLLVLKLCLNIGYIVTLIIDDINYILAPDSVSIVYARTATRFDIIIDSLIFLTFFVRFLFYFVRICKILRNNSDVLKA